MRSKFYIVSFLLVVALSGCDNWRLGFDSKDNDKKRSPEAEREKSLMGGYYIDITNRNRYFLVTLDDVFWGWDRRAEEAYYSEIEIDADADHFSGDIVSFSYDDPWVVSGEISGMFYDESDIVGKIVIGTPDMFQALYDKLYEGKATLNAIAGGYIGDGNDFLNIDVSGSFDGMWNDCAFDGSVKSEYGANYYSMTLETSPSNACVFDWGSVVEGIALLDDDTLTLVGIDEGHVKGMLLSFRED